MTEDQQGFRINTKFFAFVGYEDWLNRDFALARALTGVTTEELFDDPLMMQQALVAIAVSHDTPEMPRDAVVRFVGDLKPSDVEEVGFGEEADPVDPLPVSEPSSNGASSEPTSDALSEPTLETSTIGSSGIPGSDTGSPE